MTIITTGAIVRSVVSELPDLEGERTLDDLGEVEQQLQIAIIGTATSEIAWTDDLEITLDVEFIDATGQRYSNLTEPQVSFGPVVDSATPVVVAGCVREFVRDDRGVIVSVILAVGAYSPGEEAGIAFSGRADFSLQGYGCLPNEPADPEFDD